MDLQAKDMNHLYGSSKAWEDTFIGLQNNPGFSTIVARFMNATEVEVNVGLLWHIGLGCNENLPF